MAGKNSGFVEGNEGMIKALLATLSLGTLAVIFIPDSSVVVNGFDAATHASVAATGSVVGAALVNSTFDKANHGRLDAIRYELHEVTQGLVAFAVIAPLSVQYIPEISTHLMASTTAQFVTAGASFAGFAVLAYK